MLNEWTFETDAAGVTLSKVANSGYEGAAFVTGGTGFLETDGQGGLLFTHDDLGTTGMWTNGAVLDAAVTSTNVGVRFIRYDLEYHLNSISNDSGTVVGLTLTDSSGDELAGFILEYDVGASAAPTNIAVTEIAELSTNNIGIISVIARIDLTGQKMAVWYDLTGLNQFDEFNPNTSGIAINVTSADKLKFQATGDARSVGSDDFVNIDNIRMTSIWADIIAPIPHFSTGPAVEIVSVTVTNPSGIASTDIGEPNTVKVVVRNLSAPASNVISSVSVTDRPEYFTITSSNSPVVLTYPQYVTNTFFLVANTNTVNDTYTFHVNVTADGGVSTNTTFSLAVGSLISYLTNSITVASTSGIIPDRYEPGEILDIAVFSTNNGALAVSNVTNSLFADPAYFTISNLTSSTYLSMPVGAATSTIYRVTIRPAATNGTYWFSVTNRSGSRVWTNAFPLDVLSRGLPSVSPVSITMSVLPGVATTNTQVTVTNSGNAALTFSLGASVAWEYSYNAMTGARGISGFIPAYNAIGLNDPDTNSVGITAEYDGVSDSRSIGFAFPFYGVNYSNFYVTADGCIGLSNTTNVPLRSADRIAALPVSVGALLAPFWGKLLSPTGSIHYVRNADSLVISYTGVKQVQSGGGTNLEFQAALFTDGRIEFRYKTINGIQLAQVTAGIQNGSGSYTNLSVTPSNGVSVLLTPKRDQWVHYAPAGSVTVDSQSSQTVTFVADATGKPAGTSTNLTVWLQWSTGGSNAVTVSVNVSTAAPIYSAASTLSFTGAAGQVTSSSFTITNAGNAQLTFAIRNSAASAAGYISTNTVYNWIDISGIGTAISLNDPSPNPYITAEDEGFSSMIPLGFSFPFYGSTCTQLCVSVNGALRLDTTGRVYALWNLASTNSGMPEKMIAPFWSDLAMDADATLKYHANSERVVITWENIRQNRFSGGSNLTFQVVLRRNGEMVFQYKRLEGAQWMNTVVGLRDTASRVKQVSLLQTNDWVMTNYPSGTAYTQYVYSVSNRAVQFQTAQIPVISYTPSAGSIPAGSNAVITITGDVSALLPGFPDYTLVTNAVLGISHNAAGSPAMLSITFTATNSQQSDFVRAAAVENLTDEQKTFGTPVFAPTVSRSAAGTLLSWTQPEDGLPRTYKVYFTTDLMVPFELWSELATVTDGTSYLDTDVAHQSVSVIYYRVGVLIE